jgi:hypothetical protein
MKAVNCRMARSSPVGERGTAAAKNRSLAASQLVRMAREFFERPSILPTSVGLSSVRKSYRSCPDGRQCSIDPECRFPSQKAYICVRPAHSPGFRARRNRNHYLGDQPAPHFTGRLSRPRNAQPPIRTGSLWSSRRPFSRVNKLGSATSATMAREAKAPAQ